MPEIIMKKQEVTRIKKVERKNGIFTTKRTKECLLWKPKELHEFLKEVRSDVRGSYGPSRDDARLHIHDRR